MAAPHSKIDLRPDRTGLASLGWTNAGAPAESAATVLLVVAALSAGLICGLVVIWRSLV